MDTNFSPNIDKDAIINDIRFDYETVLDYIATQKEPILLKDMLIYLHLQKWSLKENLESLLFDELIAKKQHRYSITAKGLEQFKNLTA